MSNTYIQGDTKVLATFILLTISHTSELKLLVVMGVNTFWFWNENLENYIHKESERLIDTASLVLRRTSDSACLL